LKMSLLVILQILQLGRLMAMTPRKYVFHSFPRNVGLGIPASAQEISLSKMHRTDGTEQ
jgi:hypothetical protein